MNRRNFFATIIAAASIGILGCAYGNADHTAITTVCKSDTGIELRLVRSQIGGADETLEILVNGKLVSNPTLTYGAWKLLEPYAEIDGNDKK